MRPPHQLILILLLPNSSRTRYYCGSLPVRPTLNHSLLNMCIEQDVNKHWTGCDNILASYWMRAGEVHFSAFHVVFLLHTHRILRETELVWAVLSLWTMNVTCLFPFHSHYEYAITLGAGPSYKRCEWVARIVTNSSPFMEQECSIMSSHETANEPYPEPDKSSTHLHILVF